MDFIQPYYGNHSFKFQTQFSIKPIKKQSKGPKEKKKKKKAKKLCTIATMEKEIFSLEFRH